MYTLFRYLLLVLLLVMVFGCGPDTVKDCLEPSGKPVEKQITLEGFSKVVLGQNLSLIIEQSDASSMRVSGGANLVEKLYWEIEDGVLHIENTIDCYTFRSYDQLKIHLKTPTLKEIRSKTSYHIRSHGVLTFPVLKVLAEDFAEGFKDSATDVRVDLEINNKSCTVVTNGVSSVVLRGTTDQCNIAVAAADARIDAKDLEADRVTIFHRGSNDILVHPISLLEGELRSTGNLLVYKQPISSQVVQLYTGKLIFVAQD